MLWREPYGSVIANTVGGPGLALETWVFFALVARSILLMRAVAFMIAMTRLRETEVRGRPCGTFKSMSLFRHAYSCWM